MTFIICIYHICFFHSPTEEHSGCFHILTTVSKAPMNKDKQSICKHSLYSQSPFSALFFSIAVISLWHKLFYLLIICLLYPTPRGWWFCEAGHIIGSQQIKTELVNACMLSYISTCMHTHTHTHIYNVFLIMPHAIWDLSSLTRDETSAPCIRSTES